MASREYWIYQKRDVPTPWALWIGKTYDKRHPADTTLVFTLYHEDIPNPTHSVTSDDMPYGLSVRSYFAEAESLIREFLPVTGQDRVQLEREISRILFD